MEFIIECDVERCNLDIVLNNGQAFRWKKTNGSWDGFVENIPRLQKK